MHVQNALKYHLHEQLPIGTLLLSALLSDSNCLLYTTQMTKNEIKVL